MVWEAPDSSSTVGREVTNGWLRSLDSAVSSQRPPRPRGGFFLVQECRHRRSYQHDFPPVAPGIDPAET